MISAVSAEQSGSLFQFLPRVHGLGPDGLPEPAMRVGKQQILIVEENTALARLLATGLDAQNLHVDTAGTLEETLDLLAIHAYDVVMVGLNAGGDGAAMYREIRMAAPAARMLVLGTNGAAELVNALDNGADDYLMKPFSLVELLARVRALLRRGTSVKPKEVKRDKLVLHRDQYRVERDGRSIDLTPREFSLLDVLMKNAGKTLTRAMLTQEVWNMSADANTNIVDVYVKYLRDKIDGESDEKLIRTVRGLGYMMQVA